MAFDTITTTRPASTAAADQPLGATGKWSPEYEAAMEACKALVAAKFAAERAVAKAVRAKTTPAQYSYLANLGAALAPAKALPRDVLAAQTWDERQRALANGHATTEWRMLTGSAAHVAATDLFKSQGYA